ncbi:hypothetical protein BDQ17DRAFT_858717 [Cyathus striatus]|nr:hypothetical protein BDQ17DRAFT_858717 [Cyathus striatus]
MGGDDCSSSFACTSATFYNLPVGPSDLYSIQLHAGWGHLTELNLYLNEEPLTTINLVDFASTIICRCQSLKTLKLRITTYIADDVSVLQSADDIVLPHLTTLSLSLPLTNSALNLAKRLYIPSIKELDVQFSGLDNNEVFGMAEEIIKLLLRVHGDCLSLGLYSPDWLYSCENLVHLLKCIPHLKCLKVSSQNITNNKWVSLWPQSNQTRFQHIINNDLLYALVPLGKEHSDIVCPELEELECDDNILTSITESALKDFIKARKGDQRIGALRRISLFINDFKRDENPLEKKLSLGTGSAVFFRKPGRVLRSHLGGFKTDQLTGNTILTEVYTEI